jgi:pimeloyl-ACP methyl ester carboxylesterase
MAQLPSQKSTIVRIKFNATRAVFGALERLSPSLAARLAEPIWFRLPTPPSVDYSDFPSGAEHFSVRWQGLLVHGYRWGDGPPVYLVHGWGGNAGQFSSFIEPLMSAGFSVVTFDAPSHGLSDAGAFGPRSTHAVEMGRALDAVVAQHGQPYAIVAHSMGGVATALSVRDGWVAVPRLVLISPMVALGSHVAVLGNYLGFGERTARQLKDRAFRRVGLTVDELDLNTLFDSDDRPSLLVVHDRGDREAGYPASVSLVAGWGGAELITTTRLGHRRILDDVDVIQKVVGYLGEQLAFVSSGLRRLA